jgi:hypothetical protein
MRHPLSLSLLNVALPGNAISQEDKEMRSHLKRRKQNCSLKIGSLKNTRESI